MKFVVSELALLLSQRELRRNLPALFRYLAFLCAVIAVYSVIFHANSPVGLSPTPTES